MTNHLINFHRGENPQDFVKITILEECNDHENLKEKETIWAFRLFSFYPTGLNVREENMTEHNQGEGTRQTL